MTLFQAPRGTADRLPEEQKYWRYIEGKAVELTRRYGYGRIDSPVFEDSGLFIRSVGEGTDIVEKEMYVFEDRGGDSLTLRPEGTAPVCRAYLEHGLHNLPQPVRMYYFCPVFRFERPQAGRFRQHHQFGIEAIGDADPSVDAEVIELAWQFVTSLGLREIDLFVNSIRPGLPPRLHRRAAGLLRRPPEPALSRLPQPAGAQPAAPAGLQGRDLPGYGRGRPQVGGPPVRAVPGALGQADGLSPRLDIPFQVDLRAWCAAWTTTPVTVFEIQPRETGAQSTICGGGRYDGLIEQLGGCPTPGIGFGSGIERLTLNLKRAEIAVEDESSPRYLVAHVGGAPASPLWIWLPGSGAPGWGPC